MGLLQYSKLGQYMHWHTQGNSCNKLLPDSPGILHEFMTFQVKFSGDKKEKFDLC